MPLPLRARGGRWDSWIQPACNSDPRTHCHDMTPAQATLELLNAPRSPKLLSLSTDTTTSFSRPLPGYTTTERPEIALIIPDDYDATTLRVAVEQALTTERLLVKAYLQGDVRYYDLGQTEFANIAAATNVVGPEAARKAIDEVVEIPLQPISIERVDVAEVLKFFTTGAGNIPPAQRAEGFSVATARYERLKAVRGDAIKAEFDGLSKSFDTLSRETNTNAATVIMVISGLITVGRTTYTLYTSVQSAGSIAALVSGLFAVMGGIAAVAAVVADIAVTFGILWVLLKEWVTHLCSIIVSDGLFYTLK